MLTCCVNGLRGFPEAIKAVYSETDVQRCVIHQARSSLKLVSYKDRKKISKRSEINLSEELIRISRIKA